MVSEESRRFKDQLVLSSSIGKKVVQERVVKGERRREFSSMEIFFILWLFFYGLSVLFTSH